MAACCNCGGGQPSTLVDVELNIISSEAECKNVWQERAIFATPPWDEVSEEYCRFLNGICQRKLTASVYDEDLQQGVADITKIYQICEQRAYNLTLGADFVPAMEDQGVPTAAPSVRRLLPASDSNCSTTIKAPDARRLGSLVREATRYPLSFQQQLQTVGASLDVDFVGNQGNGMCLYRLPDPIGAYGGPSRATMPMPWLPPPPMQGELYDVFEAPSIHALGWPFQFWSALPDGGTRVGQSQEASISNRLRGLLAVEHIEFVQPPVFESRLLTWWAQLEDVTCEGNDAEFSKFTVDRIWESGTLDLERDCTDDECDLDQHVHDEATCTAMVGCDAHCLFCSSRDIATRDAGICYTESPSSVEHCGELGGIVIDDVIFDETLGRDRRMLICAMPHRPLIFCTAPGEEIKRCAVYGEERCEHDPLARLMGCGIDVRRCQTREECDVAGWCSSHQVGINWAMHGTCVITPVDDDLVSIGCVGDYCYTRLEPPIGMEVRKRSGLLDLLSEGVPEAPPSASAAFRPGSAGNGTGHIDSEYDELRRGGRLTELECERFVLPSSAVPRPRSIWLTPARNIVNCLQWKGCCVHSSGGVCEAFVGPIVDAASNPGEALEAESECSSCGGKWTSVFQWKRAEWRNGRFINKQRWWVDRGMEDANDWQELIDLDAIRHTFENAMEIRAGEMRVNSVRCILEPLWAALDIVAEACGEGASEVSNISGLVPTPAPIQVEEDATEEEIQAAEAAADAAALTLGQAEMDDLTKYLATVGSATARAGLAGSVQFGSAEVTWHEYSTAANANEDVTYTVSLQPYEYEYASAATQLALPGRSSLTRARIASFYRGSSESAAQTTTEAPPAQVNPASEPDGYPAWLVNEMIQLINPDLLRDGRETALTRAAAEESADEIVRKRAEQADASTGLPNASVQLLLEEAGAQAPSNPTSIQAGAGGIVEVPEIEAACRNVAINEFGEVIGYLQGDCVRLQVSAPIANSVELCLHLNPSSDVASLFDMSAFEGTMGLTYDFALKDTVPVAYNSTAPSTTPEWVLQLGSVPQALWTWASNRDYGRLQPDSAYFTALAVNTSLQRNGSVLCAKVYHNDSTYCPILRLNHSIYRPLPIYQPEDGPILSSNCEALDLVLAHIQGAHALSGLPEAPYRSVEKVASDQELMNVHQALRASQYSEEAAGGVSAAAGDVLRCVPGMCLMPVTGQPSALHLVPEAQGGSSCILTCPSASEGSSQDSAAVARFTKTARFLAVSALAVAVASS